jgi:hypothetical protein
VKRNIRGKVYFQKLVSIPLTRIDIQAGDYIKFKKMTFEK